MVLRSAASHIVLAGVLFGFAAPTPAHTQDGRIVESTVVTLEEDTVRKIVDAQPDMRGILEQVEIRSMTYLSDGLKVRGYLVAPKTGEGLPCIIFNRGGNREFGALNDLRVGFSLARMASWGYVVVASNYRGTGGGDGEEEFGGSDLDDVLNLLPMLEALPRADASRVGMVGWSRGGLMTSLALTRTDRLKAAVIGAGVFDSKRLVEDRPEMETEVYAQLVPGYEENKAAALDARSPVLWAEKLSKKTPLLILHGAADKRVNPRQALDMASRLYEHGHPFRLVFFEGAGHGIREHRAEVDRLTKDWLDRYVRDLKQ